MTERVTGDQVKKIIDTTLIASEISLFIKAANLLVTDWLGNSGLTEPHLKEIERWLSAHLVAIRSQDSVSKAEKTGDASITRHGQTGLGLDFTPYGQQVKVLDITGTMANLGLKPASLETINFLD
jgi:hypothetical protein